MANRLTDLIAKIRNNIPLSWRNAADTADLELKVNAENKLEFDGEEVAIGSGLADAISSHTGNTSNPHSTTLEQVAGSPGTGILAKTAAATAVGRTIIGTADQISVNDGDGVSGNPTLALANNPTIPGNEGMIVPVGNTS